MWEKIEAIMLLIFFVIWSLGWLTTYIALKAVMELPTEPPNEGED